MGSIFTFGLRFFKTQKKRKEVPANLGVSSATKMVVGLKQGLNVVARVNKDPNFLKGIVSSGLSIFSMPDGQRKQRSPAKGTEPRL